MANVKYSDLLDEVLPLLPADPSDPVTENAIKRAVIEFCATTWLWKYLPDTFLATPGEGAYLIETLPGTDVSAVLSVQFDGLTLEQKSVDWLNENVSGWRTNRGQVRYFTQVDTEEIILAPLPDSAGVLAMTLALQPNHTATGFPKWIFNQYVYTLADGALSKLMLMSGKPWSDGANGLSRKAAFEAGMANAKTVSVTALGRATLRTTSQH